MEKKRDDLRCAPTKNLSNGTCYTIDQLKNIATSYNNNNNNNKIIQFDENTTKKRLLYRIMKNITNETKCDNQICWLKQDFMKNNIDYDLLKNTFRPKGPANEGNYKWLSNFDIQKVMKQYEIKYDDFCFLGAVPVDFFEINYNNLSNINFDYLYDNKPKLGLIINLDKHNQSGSHWVSLFINLKNNEIYFSDSVGNRPPKEVRYFINKVVNFCDKKNNMDDNSTIQSDVSFMNGIKKNKYEKKYPIKFNQNNIQKSNSECGVFSINFILRLLKGEKFEEYIETAPNDEEVNKCRNIYFIDEEKY